MSTRVMNLTIHAKEDHLVSLGFNASCIPGFMESFVNPHMDSATSGTLNIGVTQTSGVSMTLVEDGRSVKLDAAPGCDAGNYGNTMAALVPYWNLLRALNSSGAVRTGPLFPEIPQGIDSIGFVAWLCQGRYRSGFAELSIQPLCNEIGSINAPRIIAGMATDHFGVRTGKDGLSGEDLHAVLSYKSPRCNKVCLKLSTLKELRQASYLAATMYSMGCYCDSIAPGSRGPRTALHQYSFVGHNISITVALAAEDDDEEAEEPSASGDGGTSGKASGRRQSLFFRGIRRVIGEPIHRAKRSQGGDDATSSFGDSVAYTASRLFSGTAWLWLPQGFLLLTGLVVSASRHYADVADRDKYTFYAKVFMAVLSALLFAVRVIDGYGGYIGLDFLFSANKTMVVMEYMAVTLTLFMTMGGLNATDRIPFGQSSAVQYLCSTFGVYVVAIVLSEVNPDALLLVFTLLLFVSFYGFYTVARNATATTDSFPMIVLLWNFVTCVATEFWALSSTLSAAYSPQIGAIVYIANDFLPYSLYCDSPFFIVRAAVHLDEATVWADSLTSRPWLQLVGIPALVFFLRVAVTLVPRCIIAFRTVRAPTFDSAFSLLAYSLWAYLVDMFCIWRHFVNILYGFHTRPSSGMLLIHIFFIYIDYTCLRELFYMRVFLSTLWWLSGASLVRLSSASMFASSVRLSTKEFRIPGALPSVHASDLYSMCQSNYRVQVLDADKRCLASGTCVISMVNTAPTVTTISHFSDCLGTPAFIKIIGTPPGQERFTSLVLTVGRPSLLPMFPKADPVTRYVLSHPENGNLELGFLAGLKQGFADATPDDIAAARMIYVHTYERESMTPLQDLSLSFKPQGPNSSIEEVAVDVCLARGDSGGGAFLVMSDGAVRYLGAISRAVPAQSGDASGPKNLVSVVGCGITTVMELHRLISIPMTRALRSLPLEELRGRRLAAVSSAEEADRQASKLADEFYQLSALSDDDKTKPKRRLDKEREKDKAKDRAKRMRHDAGRVRDQVAKIVEENLDEFKGVFTAATYNLPGDWRLRKLPHFRPYDVVMHYVADSVEGLQDENPRLTTLLSYLDTVLPIGTPDAPEMIKFVRDPSLTVPPPWSSAS